MKNTVIEQGIHTLIHFPLGLKGILFNCDVAFVRYGSKYDGMAQQQ